MKFYELTEKLKNRLTFTAVNAVDAEINFLAADSRKTVQGTMFACVKGEHSDGHDFASKAAELGAVALVCERKLDIPLPQIICSDVRRNMGIVAACLYDNPADKLKLAAVTGTTGKTTSTFMTKAVLDYAGIRCGLLGTILYDDGRVVEEAPRTTPEADVIQYKLSQMVKNGCKACVMEASSHAIAQGRIEGCRFDAAGFTNLTQDHLDYHKTMENYFEAKKQLFEKYMRGNWKVSAYADNEYSRKTAEEFSGNSVTYSLENENADYYARLLSVTVGGMNAELRHGKESFVTKLPLLGSHNVLNALQALSIAEQFGVSFKQGIEALKNMPQVPGRLERYVIKNSGCCVIDFAHAPDGMEKLLTALRSVCEGRLIAIFGAGGDRDKTKRPIMGEIAARLADYVVLTTDNPRSEEPETIIDEIAAGVEKHNTPYIKITDRREAVYKGLSMLKKGDIAAVIGKGPESYMEIKGKKIPLSDKEILSDWCKAEGRETE